MDWMWDNCQTKLAWGCLSSVQEGTWRDKRLRSSEGLQVSEQAWWLRKDSASNPNREAQNHVKTPTGGSFPVMARWSQKICKIIPEISAPCFPSTCSEPGTICHNTIAPGKRNLPGLLSSSGPPPDLPPKNEGEMSRNQQARRQQDSEKEDLPSPLSPRPQLVRHSQGKKGKSFLPTKAEMSFTMWAEGFKLRLCLPPVAPQVEMTETMGQSTFL